jgi:hypothetical protein
MRDFLQQIDAALDANLYYVAIFSALAVPDVCAALESPAGTTSGQQYADWFDRHVAKKYVAGGSPSLSGQQCYEFRCSLLHQGRLQPDRTQRYSRMFFIEPTVGGLIMHNNVMNDVLNIDVRIFCRDIIASALAWLTAAEGTEPYESNVKRSIQRYPNGIEPWVKGLPAIG